MTEYKEYDEIRGLIARWYEGGTTPDQERRLADFFATAGELPADLEMERSMFQAIDAADGQEVEIPEELARRIDTALEAEMEQERHASTVTSRFRRWMVATGAVAASLVAALMVHTFVVKDNDPVTQRPQLAVNTPSVPVTSVPDTAASVIDEVGMVASASPQTKDKAKRRPAPSARKAKVSGAPVLDDSVESESDDDMYLTEAEEQRLMAANYRVVRDEREADAILSSVFVHLEGSIVEESYRIGDINAEYEMEMTKLYN